jgi:hypothetical protein
MLKTNFAPLYDISMMDNKENFADTLTFPSSPFSSSTSSLLPKIKLDPNLKNSTTISSSVSKTPGSEIDNLKMNTNANVNNTSSSNVTDDNKNNSSSTNISSESSNQDKSSSAQTSISSEQSQPNSSTVDYVPSRLNTNGIVQTVKDAENSITSYLYYFIGIFLLIAIGIAVFIFTSKKSKPSSPINTTTTLSDESLGTSV